MVCLDFLCGVTSAAQGVLLTCRLCRSLLGLPGPLHAPFAAFLGPYPTSLCGHRFVPDAWLLESCGKPAVTPKSQALSHSCVLEGTSVLYLSDLTVHSVEPWALAEENGTSSKVNCELWAGLPLQ